VFGLEIFFMLLVVLVVSAVERRRRKQRVSHDLDDWAKQLGMVRVGNELFGQLDGIPVGARLAFDGPHKTKAQARWTLYARLQPPLDLGILVSNRLMPVELPSAGHIEAYGFGGDFDRRFAVLCDEPVRAHALLTPAVRHVMMRRLHPNAMFMLTDSGVAVQAVHGRAGETMLRSGLQAVAAIADHINTAREAVPAARPLQTHGIAWSRFAHGNGLQTITAPLCMFGTIEDATMYAYSVRANAGEFHLEVWLRFEDPLGLGLLVQPMRTVDRMKEMFGAADYKLGDALFDETFLVRVSDERGTVALLDEKTRKRLLIIHDTVGPLSLTDDGISVRLPHVPPEPAVVPTIVRQMLEIARFIADKRRFERTAGPYR
jgi:hypothetical protein